jgi:hypothetical protein
MLDAVVRVPPLPDLLDLFGPGGTALGLTIGSFARACTWRQVFENVALGAAVGGAFGCLAVFVVYFCLQVLA